MEKKIITIRFHMGKQEDRQIYEQLEGEAGTSASLASVAKARIRESYQSRDRIIENAEFQEQIKAVIREEMQESGAKIAGALLSGMHGTGNMIQPLPEVEESRLPEESGELPRGALDFLE